MDEASGEMNVKEAMTAVADHFFFIVHDLGFSGSLGPLNLT